MAVACWDWGDDFMALAFLLGLLFAGGFADVSERSGGEENQSKTGPSGHKHESSERVDCGRCIPN